jgi:hypothetical protein
MNNNNIKNNNTTRQRLLASKLARQSRWNSTPATLDGGAWDSKNSAGPTSTPHSRLSLSNSIRSSGSNALSTRDNNNVTSHRYKPNDQLLYKLPLRWNSAPHTHSTLVNAHGFPPGEGNTPAELRGPYHFVLATVQSIHFDEIQPYYTVKRADTNSVLRAEGDDLVPFQNPRAVQAADEAAQRPITDPHADRHSPQNRTSDSPATHPAALCGYALLLPFLAFYDALAYLYLRYFRPLVYRVSGYVQHKARLILNGVEPFVCQVRLTLVNFVVLCSVWYVFADQARLAFFPPSSDVALAYVNASVWLVLVLELILEVFVRPDGYRDLLMAEKAYAPTTVRYIHGLHVLVETIALVLFIPEFYCLISSYRCDARIPVSFHHAAFQGVTGPTGLDAFYGRAYFAVVRLRVFGLVRHWRNMWIANTFLQASWKKSKAATTDESPEPSARQTSISTTVTASSLRPSEVSSITTAAALLASSRHSEKSVDDTEGVGTLAKDNTSLTDASTIGTALMATNSYRALAILWFITGVFPLLWPMGSFYHNKVASSMTAQLQGTNVLVDESTPAGCAFLADSVRSWLAGLYAPDFALRPDAPYVVALGMEPSRCWNTTLYEWVCNDVTERAAVDADEELVQLYCDWWTAHQAGSSEAELADILGLREGSVQTYRLQELANQTLATGETAQTIYSVAACFDESFTIETAAFASLLLQLCLLVLVLGGLSVLRGDAEVLVLGPLRRMLKIVARYAKNPLIQPRVARQFVKTRRFVSSRGDDDENSDSSSDAGPRQIGDRGLALGSYETTQLITAVTKITDLLRKCWGVAGADIISTNLATREGALTEVFNPTVPGKSVYALFGFAGIDGFDHALRSLGGDVMILINDVAAVLHDEVFRWGLHDSGQCNKNLGSAFLMVFRIGLVKEVTKKLEQATDVVFNTATNKSSGIKRRKKNAVSSRNMSKTSGSTSRRTPLSRPFLSVASIPRVAAAKKAAYHFDRKAIQRSSSTKAMSLSLASLPGISTFTDRAVIGMLKSFAGIHRDGRIRNWNDDFRLGAGVGAFTVNMNFGMDAGWAVEGAVGSEYKIDATYLSPHVNMASRMMGASKQYGVSIMLSQAVQELMSDVARSKLRHLDTVTVKGSLLQQRIYTYDARYKGVDFFLHSRPEEQADIDAEVFSSNTWNTDPDLRAMRQHVTDEFIKAFNGGRKAFIAGDWTDAIVKLERANEIMMETALEEGYLEDELEEVQIQAGDDSKGAAEALKRETGDGPR